MQQDGFRNVMGRAASALGAGLLVVAALGCGGSSNDQRVVLPPGGVPVGELLCRLASVRPGDAVVQGDLVVVTFRIEDANGDSVPGAFLPVSYEVLGGAIDDPPDMTDANGEATVSFRVFPDSLGLGLVRMIQPDNDLRCDVTFRIVQAACTVSAVVLDELGVVIGGTEGCGGAALPTEPGQARSIVFTITRPDPLSGDPAPVAGATLLISVIGQGIDPVELGPSDESGRITVVLSDDGHLRPRPAEVGELTVVAEVIIGDSNADDIPDSLPCLTCEKTFDIAP
jgi:hypothetical protein